MSSDGKPKLAPKTPLVPLQAVLGLDLASLPLSSGNDGGSEDDSPPLAKRRKNELDSIEREKRRKIRNRIASQNSRDKKKKQVEDLEQRIAYLERLNQKLLLENDKLREKTSFLQTQNASLQPPPQEDPSKCPPRLSSDVLLSPTRSSDFSSTSGEELVRTGTSRSAALGCVSLQQKWSRSKVQPLNPKATPPMKASSTWIKLLLMMSLIESLPSSMILKPKTLSFFARQKALTSRSIRSLSRQDQNREPRQECSNLLVLLGALKWWKAHDKRWSPPKK